MGRKLTAAQAINRRLVDLSNHYGSMTVRGYIIRAIQGNLEPKKGISNHCINLVSCYGRLSVAAGASKVWSSAIISSIINQG